jgi:uncharacterized protein involved in exopolysaccharide biosynthesis
VEREITLRDYGRVLWRGRWIIIATTVVAALVGLVLSFVGGTEYTATARVYLGQATSVTGIPIATPATNNVTASDVLERDEITTDVAESIGVGASRVRSGVEVSVPEARGAAAMAPTVATVTFTDSDRDVAKEGAEAYAAALVVDASENYDEVVAVYEQRLARGQAELARLDRQIQTFERQLAANAGTDQEALYQSLLFSTIDRKSDLIEEVGEQELNIAKAQQIEQPTVVTKTATVSSNAATGSRTRTVGLAAAIGLLIGIVIAFVWRGAPSSRETSET